jgi:hypothetical protein
MPSEEPIALIHWGDVAVENDEIEEIKLLLEATLFDGDRKKQAERAPQIVQLRIISQEITVLQRKLSCFLSKHRNLQVLYWTCHGNTAGFCFNQGDNSSISYLDFCDILSKSLRDNDCIHVVFGSCEAMDTHTKIEELMPNSVYCVSGFTYCPTSTDVAGLIASIIQDNVVIFNKLSSCNSESCGNGVTMKQIRDVVKKWKAILDTHKDNPTREVLGTGGIAVVQATREPDTGEWKRRTTPCFLTV